MADQEIGTEKPNTSDNVEDLQKTATIDTLHNDEALKVLATYTGDQEWSQQEEKKLVKKIDRRLLSVLCATYGLQYYDKAMLSQAALFGLREDLELNVGIRYSMSASIFYLGFIVGAYPAILLAQRYPIERVIFGIVLLWGICLMCTAACTNWQGLYAQRFFLGALESGVSPGWMLVVGSFYKKQEQALRMGYVQTEALCSIALLMNIKQRLVFNDWICLRGIATYQLRFGSYQRVTITMALYVPRRRCHHDPLELRYSLFHATGPYPSKGSIRPGAIYCRGTTKGEQHWCAEHTFQDSPSLGAPTRYQVLDGVCHGFHHAGCKRASVNLYAYYYPRPRF
jgi:hypothetical protein